MIWDVLLEPLEAKLPVGRAYRLMLRTFSRDDLEQLMRTQLDPPRILVDYSAQYDTWPKCLLNTLDAADRENWFDELLTAAKNARQKHPAFVAAIDRLLAGIGVTEPEDGEARKRIIRTNLLILITLIPLVCLWCFLVLGTSALMVAISPLAVISGLAVATSKLNLRFVRVMDEMFAIGIGKRWMCWTLSAVAGIGLLASLFIGAIVVKTDVQSSLYFRTADGSTPSTLDSDKPQIILTFPLAPTVVDVSIEGYEARTAKIYPWWQRRIRQADLQPTTYLVVFPSDANEGMFHPEAPVDLRVTVSNSDVVYEVNGYIGEPLMLGIPDDRIGTIEIEEPIPLARIAKRPPTSARHQLRVKTRDGETVRLTTTTKEISLTPDQQLSFRCDLISPLGTRSCYNASVKIQKPIRSKTAVVSELSFQMISCDE